jgi:ubiquitin-protein ligase E3 A
MFQFNDSTGLYWLNPTCTECSDEFRLIGVLYALALYNNVLMDVHFPMVLYRKLLGAPVSYHDLADHDPVRSVVLCTKFCSFCSGVV